MHIQIENSNVQIIVASHQAEPSSEFIHLREGVDFLSKSIEVITYEHPEKLLGVKFFKGNKIYLYENVPLNKVFSFIRQESPNKYWRSEIRAKHTEWSPIDYESYIESKTN